MKTERMLPTWWVHAALLVFLCAPGRMGFSWRKVPHLAGLSAVGVNCASCHVADMAAAEGGAPVRVLGATSHFDAEAFFGAVIVATFRTADPSNMRRFLAAYLAESDPAGVRRRIAARSPAACRGPRSGGAGALDAPAFPQHARRAPHSRSAARQGSAGFRLRRQPCVRIALRRALRCPAAACAGEVRRGLESRPAALGPLGRQHAVSARAQHPCLARARSADGRQTRPLRFRARRASHHVDRAHSFTALSLRD
jgi:hypothetical protein